MVIGIIVSWSVLGAFLFVICARSAIESRREHADDLEHLMSEVESALTNSELRAEARARVREARRGDYR